MMINTELTNLSTSALALDSAPVAAQFGSNVTGMTIRKEFTADPDGYHAYKSRQGMRFSEGTDAKWMPIIRNFDRTRTGLGLSWNEINDATVEYVLIPAMIDEYRIRYSKEPTANTLRGWWDALRSYFEYLHGTQRISDNFMNHVPKPSYRVQRIAHLTPEQDCALAFCDKDPLESIVIGLLRENGLRAEEARELDEADVDVKAACIRIRDGKSPASTRTLPLGPSLIWKINGYRQHKKELGIVSSRFVATKKTGRITNQYIWVIVKRVAARAGVGLHACDEFGNPVALDKTGQNLSTVSPHVLRKTYGMDLINSEVELAVVSDLLGHAHQGVTEDAYAEPLQEIRNLKALRAATSGPYGTVKALDGIEAKVLTLQATTTDVRQLNDRIDSLITSLEATRASIALLAA